MCVCVCRPTEEWFNMCVAPELVDNLLPLASNIIACFVMECSTPADACLQPGQLCCDL